MDFNVSQKLFEARMGSSTKLSESGSIRYLDDRDVIENHDGGAWNSQLARQDSPPHESFDEASPRVSSGAHSNGVGDKSARPGKGAISGRAIVRDIKSGMTGLQLMVKYELSSEQLKKAVEIVLKERRRIAMVIAEDVRSRLTASQLMEKYQLSYSGLQKVCEKLLTEGLVQAVDINDLNLSVEETAPLGHERRRAPRRSPSLPITVFDKGGRGSKGTIKDISEKGLGVRGIPGVVGQSKTLYILGDDFGFVDPFEVEAECRWAGTEGPGGQQVAGFQIIAISDEDLGRLQELICLPDPGTGVIS